MLVSLLKDRTTAKPTSPHRTHTRCACSYAMSSLVTPVVINYCINTNPDLFPDTAPRYMDDTGVKTKTPELNLHRPVREISGP